MNIPTIKDHDWEHTVYGKHEEEIPLDTPPPLGKRIVLTHYFDARLMHDVLSGKAVTGVCTFYNRTHVDWFASSNIQPKFPHMVLNSCLEEPAVTRSLTIDQAFDTWASQYTT